MWHCPVLMCSFVVCVRLSGNLTDPSKKGQIKTNPQKCFIKAFNLGPLFLFRYDYVEVRDGVDESGQLVGKYCGKIAPSPVVSSGNQLFIKFVSDYETHGAGFSIRYEIFKTGGWPLFEIFTTQWKRNGNHLLVLKWLSWPFRLYSYWLLSPDFMVCLRFRQLIL